MTPIRMNKNMILDGEKIFRMYFTDMGSARSIGKVIKQLGTAAVNPNTGRTVTHMAIWFSLWRWAMENLDLSYQIFSYAMRDEGKYHTKEEWIEFVNTHARTIVKKSERKLEKWQNRVNQKMSEKMTAG
jgi:hypothetical protein